MSKCNHNRDVLDAYTVGAGGLAELDREHAATCERCSKALAEAEEMRKILVEYASQSALRAERILQEAPVPAGPRTGTVPWGRLAPWMATAAAVIVIVLASSWRGGRDPGVVRPVIAGASLQYLQQVKADSERVAMTSYLHQSRTLFLSLLYGTTDCEEGNVEIGAEKQMARELLRRKKLLEPELSQPGRGDVRPVFDELELLLLEVATGEDCVSRDRFDSWKQTVESRRTMQKLQLLQMKGRI